jgi:putative peptidoglycan lipid II flippase
MALLRRTLNARIGPTGLPASYVSMLWLAAAAGAATAWAIKLTVPIGDPIVAAGVILAPYGLVFFAIAFALRIPEASSLVGRLTARRRR